MQYLYKIKRIISFILLSLIITNISNYAAIVSSDDGSAFVNKADFEALKEEFDSQLERYNNSIDRKIDGAIANYIAGINVVKPISENIINKTWKQVSAISGALDNTFKVPNLNLQFMLGTIYSSNGDVAEKSTPSQVSGAYWTAVTHWSRLSYEETWSTTKNCYRNLVTCTGPTPNNLGDIIWDGQALRYKEIWNISRAIPRNIHWAWLDRPGDETFSVKMINFTTLKTAGYFTNWDTVKNTVWPIVYEYKYTGVPSPPSGASGTGTQNISFNASETYDNFRTSVVLDPDDEGNTKRYEHIIGYKGDTEWRVSNPNFLTLLNAPPAAESNITSSTIATTAARTQDAKYCGAAHHVKPHQMVMDTLPITYDITDNSIIPNIGLFGTKRKNNVMYQDNVKTNIAIDDKNTTVEKKKPKLHEGFQLLAAKEGDRITWEPQFSYTHVHNTATTYRDNAHEVDIYFSYGPFSDMTNTVNPIRVKVGNGTTLQNYAITDSRKCKVEFTMPADGIVYVKWIPHNVSSTYLNSDWILTLNLEKCNTYVYIRE